MKIAEENKGLHFGTYRFGYLLGARYGQLEQDFQTTFNFAPPSGTTTATTAVDFDGAGLRFGLDGERELIPYSGLTVYGRSVANLLAGKFRSTYYQVNQFNGVEVDTAVSDDKIVPVLEFEFGLAFLPLSTAL